MMTQIDLITDSVALYRCLCDDLPEGVTITSDPPIERRGITWDFNVNIDIQLAVDLSKIAAYTFAAWLISRSEKINGKHKVEIHQKQVSLGQQGGIEKLVKAIGHDESDKKAKLKKE